VSGGQIEIPPCESRQVSEARTSRAFFVLGALCWGHETRRGLHLAHAAPGVDTQGQALPIALEDVGGRCSPARRDRTLRRYLEIRKLPETQEEISANITSAWQKRPPS
jgi:hypothetical protein